MRFAHRWSDRNLTRLELAVSLLIIAILIGVFSKRVLVIFARAESALVNTTIANINTSLQYYAINAAMHNDTDTLAGLATLNPFGEIRARNSLNNLENFNSQKFINDQYYNWLPSNYLGRLANPDLETIPAGYWFYDTDKNILVYKVNNTEFFQSNLEGVPRIRFKIYIDYDDTNLDGNYEADIDSFKGIKLKSLDHYEWLFERKY